MRPVSVRASTHNSILAEGYKLVEDAWVKDGRRTYVHDDDASGVLIRRLIDVLRSDGWEIDRDKLRSLAALGCAREEAQWRILRDAESVGGPA
jgi:hypothetical protein